MKNTLIFIVISFFLASCASKHVEVSNDTLYQAIVEQGKIQNESLNRIAGILIENKKPVITPQKIVTPSRFGNTVSDEEILGTSVSLKKSERTATVSSENPLEKRVATLEKKFKKIEKSDRDQNLQLSKIKATMRRLNIAIAENGGMENTGRFIIDGSKQEAPEQIEATVEKISSYYSGLENPSGNYVIIITAYNEKGVASEKSSKKAKELLVKALKKKELNGKFSVNISTDGKKNKKLAGGIVISNPFI